MATSCFAGDGREGSLAAAAAEVRRSMLDRRATPAPRAMLAREIPRGRLSLTRSMPRTTAGGCTTATSLIFTLPFEPAHMSTRQSSNPLLPGSNQILLNSTKQILSRKRSISLTRRLLPNEAF